MLSPVVRERISGVSQGPSGEIVIIGRAGKMEKGKKL